MKLPALPQYTISAAQFPVPNGLFLPCFCIACRPAKRRTRALLQPLSLFMPPRIGAPDSSNDTYRASTDGLLELMTTTICRAHGPKPGQPVTLRPIRGTASQMTRTTRVLAFLHRCLASPADIDNYRATAGQQPWLPVPEWNFEGHDAAAPEIARLRSWLAEHSIAEVFDLSGPYATQPWELPAFLAAERLCRAAPDAIEYPSGLPAPGHPGAKLAYQFAVLCSTLAALGHADPLVSTVARRVAFAPDPLDVWPWVPRWAPSFYGSRDRALRAGSVVPPMPQELRGWWNLNALSLRPRAFAPHEAALHLRRIAEFYVDQTGQSAYT